MISKLLWIKLQSFNNDKLTTLRRINDFLMGTLVCLIFLGIIGLELSYSKFSTKYKSLGFLLPTFPTQPIFPLYPEKDLTNQID